MGQNIADERVSSVSLPCFCVGKLSGFNLARKQRAVFFELAGGG